MKNTFAAASFSILMLLGSCTTTVLSSKKQNTVDAVVVKGKTYTFLKNDGSKVRFRVGTIDENTITGKTADEKIFVIEKNEISEIRKNNSLGTGLIVAAGLAAIIVIPAFVQNKAVGQ